MRPTRVAALCAMSALVGSLLGPAAVEAAGWMSIKDPKTNSKARVVQGRLRVDAGSITADVNGSTMATLPSYAVAHVTVPGAPGMTVTTLTTEDVVLHSVVVSNLEGGNPQLRRLWADVDCDGVGQDDVVAEGYLNGAPSWESGPLFVCGPVEVGTDASFDQAVTLYGREFESPGDPAQALDAYVGGS